MTQRMSLIVDANFSNPKFAKKCLANQQPKVQ